MENVKRGTRAAAHGLMREEYKAWLYFYQSVASDEQLAAEVLSQLEADVQMKRQHLALYVRCKQSLRVHKTRRRRNQRIGEGVRRLCELLFLAPLRGLRNMGRQSGDLALECLPASGDRPVGRLPQGSAPDFDPHAEVIPGSAVLDEASPGTNTRRVRPKPSALQ